MLDSTEKSISCALSKAKECQKYSGRVKRAIVSEVLFANTSEFRQERETVVTEES